MTLSNDLNGVNSKSLLLNKNILNYKDSVAALKTNGLSGLSNARSTGITEKDIANLEAYNDALRQGKNPMSAYYSTMMYSSNAAKQLATNARGAEVNTSNLTVTTKSSTVAMVPHRQAISAW